jgi:general secretion pathway protein G
MRERSRRPFARHGGFTMIELLVVMAILGILAAAIMPLGEALVRSSQERELRRSLWEVRSAIDEYKRAVDAGALAVPADESHYPPNLEVLVSGIDDARADAKGRRLYFLRRIPRDPLADLALPAPRTWKLRSYASPPDKPEAGADVYDVRSSSDGVALDGTSYASW